MLAAVDGDYGTSSIWTSADVGASWTDINVGFGYGRWTGISASEDGVVLAAVTSYDRIWVSGDAGASWTEASSTCCWDWRSIASSSNGTKLAAVASYGSVWLSSDSGSSWTQATSCCQSWTSITSSSDGTTLAAVEQNGYVWVSHDAGASWTTVGTAQNWMSITSSADVGTLAAVVGSGNIWLSGDAGATWSEVTAGAAQDWRDIASSADGTKLAAVCDSIWLSHDAGATWTEVTTAEAFGDGGWQSVASSSDGSKLAAGEVQGHVWLSTDSGATWTTTPLAPTVAPTTTPAPTVTPLPTKAVLDYTQAAKIIADDGVAYDGFGDRSMAADGDIIVVGAYMASGCRTSSPTGAPSPRPTGGSGDEDEDEDDYYYYGDDCRASGAVYLFRTTDGGITYAQVAKLTASDAAANDRFGISVAIDGNTIVIGAYYKSSGTGAVYVFRTSDGGATYDEIAKLTAADAASGDYFGYSVAIDGNTVVVGAYYDDDGGSSSGSVYIFHTSDGGATYDEVAKLTASDAASYDYFGYSVAIAGGTVVVSAYRDDDGGSSSGSVYIFHTSDGGATYDEVAKLTASDAASYDYFGYSVAIAGGTVVVGAYYKSSGRGAVYVFRTSDGGATYDELTKLTADDASHYDYFGYSVAIQGDKIAVGASSREDGRGSAYIFLTSDGGATYQAAMLMADDAVSYEEFGKSVALAGGLVVVGSEGERRSGAIYVFAIGAPTAQPTTASPTTSQPTYSPTTAAPTNTPLLQMSKLVATDASSYDNFGYSVAIDGNTIVVGTRSKRAVYVFRTTDGGATYDEVAKLTASDDTYGYFGYSVAVAGDTIVVGDYYENSRRGAVYIFHTSDGGATYDEVAKLTADEAESYDYFGYSVAIAGGTVVVGAYGDDDASGCTDDWCNSGSVYIFHTSDGGATYDLVAKLTATDAVESDHFGESVAIHSSLVVVGAPHHDDADWDSGAVYVFRTEDGGASWSPLAKLTPSDGVEDAEFGSSVAVHGNFVAAGAPDDDEYRGAVYIFLAAGSGAYVQVAKIVASDGAKDDRFGYSVAFFGDIVAIGAKDHDHAACKIYDYDDDYTNSDCGSVYIFHTSDGGATFVQVAKLKADDPAAYDQFGHAVAMSGDVVVRVKTNRRPSLPLPGCRECWASITRKNVDFRTGRRGRGALQQAGRFHLGRWLGLRLRASRLAVAGADHVPRADRDVRAHGFSRADACADRVVPANG